MDLHETVSHGPRAALTSLALGCLLVPLSCAFAETEPNPPGPSVEQLAPIVFPGAKQSDGTIEWTVRDIGGRAELRDYNGKTMRAKPLGVVELTTGRYALVTISKAAPGTCEDCSQLVSAFVVKDKGAGHFEAAERFSGLASVFYEDGSVAPADLGEDDEGFVLETHEGSEEWRTSAIEIFRLSEPPGSLTSGAIPLSRSTPKDCEKKDAKGVPVAECYDIKGSWSFAVHPGRAERDLVIDTSGILAQDERPGSRNAKASAVYEIDEDGVYSLASGQNLADPAEPD
jgi:hypothetical protein